MKHLLRQFLLLCALAGMSLGMVHNQLHREKDDCASHCDAQHEESHDPGHDENHDGVAHHHVCCHFPTADRSVDSSFARVSLRSSLLEISIDHSMIPDEPVRELDKPPLI